MEFQRNPCLKLTLVLIATFHSVHSQLTGTDCSGKTYYCLNDQQFQVCIDLPGGNSQTVDDLAYPCPSDSFCDNAGQSECDSQTRPTTMTTVAPVSTTTTNLPSSTEAPFSCTKPGRFPNRNDCHRYYTCTAGLRQTDSSCIFGMAFDPVGQRCTSDQSPCQSKFSCQSSGRFPDPSDSSSYFWCLRIGSGFTMYHMSCAFGQPFDPIKGRCAGWLGIRQGGAGVQVMRMASPGRGGYNK
ncbi:probable endochitinase [Ochlerotatus camptorhynchus]|uniref:probable endochitinase n=1 Tax=Ochlerotatus camptorhynchus TaxID=644619 RepID=UPI0031D25B91